jgi:hypothetical protein
MQLAARPTAAAATRSRFGVGELDDLPPDAVYFRSRRRVFAGLALIDMARHGILIPGTLHPSGQFLGLLTVIFVGGGEGQRRQVAERVNHRVQGKRKGPAWSREKRLWHTHRLSYNKEWATTLPQYAASKWIRHRIASTAGTTSTTLPTNKLRKLRMRARTVTAACSAGRSRSCTKRAETTRNEKGRRRGRRP